MYPAPSPSVPRQASRVEYNSPRKGLSGEVRLIVPGGSAFRGLPCTQVIAAEVLGQWKAPGGMKYIKSVYRKLWNKSVS
ncbi:hypothetical protein E2C01_081456 [Portunus trituberculatus]|uniref:Uncharacterized protein n=1 Tax=Portunus trituberculatus TaxID=210409 RepID=A0A5B7IMB2_PORTR|nr:hypothetical protein [Portunus trituberculatus]